MFSRCRISTLIFFLLLAVVGFGVGPDPFAFRWDYEGAYSPENWHNLSKETRICGMGHHQSPIDIQTKEILELKQSLEIHYHEAPLKVVNNGHTVEFDATDRHFIVLDGQSYYLKQFHFHAHSEHSLDGLYFPAEMHLVHQSEQGGLVVLAVFQEVSDQEPSHHLFEEIPSEGDSTEVSLDIESLLPESRTRYVYDGSLTTPPCTENVTWLVFKEPVKISADELNQFRHYYTHNYRPRQDEFLRKVYGISL